MKRFIWNVQLALALHQLADCPFLVSWSIARGSDDAFNEGLTARDAALSELSYWGE